MRSGIEMILVAGDVGEATRRYVAYLALPGVKAPRNENEAVLL